MSADQMVFATGDPEIVAHFEEVLRLRKQRHAEIVAWMDEHGFDVIVRGGISDQASVGLSRREGRQDPIPEGFTQYKSYDYLTPNKRTKDKGAAAKQLLRELSPYPVRGAMSKRCGIPAVVSGPGHFYSPAFRLFDGELFVSFSGEQDEWTPGEPWRRVRLSEYYAHLESDEATP